MHLASLRWMSINILQNCKKRIESIDASAVYREDHRREFTDKAKLICQSLSMADLGGIVGRSLIDIPSVFIVVSPASQSTNSKQRMQKQLSRVESTEKSREQSREDETRMRNLRVDIGRWKKLQLQMLLRQAFLTRISAQFSLPLTLAARTQLLLSSYTAHPDLWSPGLGYVQGCIRDGPDLRWQTRMHFCLNARATHTGQINTGIIKHFKFLLNAVFEVYSMKFLPEILGTEKNIYELLIMHH